MPSALPTEVGYVALLFGLFVVPRMLQRYRIPSAVTALVFGAIAGFWADAIGSTALHADATISLLSTLGIVALFLFAGLDVEVNELYRERVVLIEHVVIRVVSLVVMVLVIVWLLNWLWGFNVERRPALLIALAVLTPSTGFILDSFGRWGLSQDERFWIKSKVIATELVALAVLFVVLQSTSTARLSLSALTIILMVAVLPAVFRWFASAVVPHAPNSEFGFLMMVAVACAVVTRQLGVYYLVGAFAVGMAAQQYRRQLPLATSERIFGAVESFASLFVPFYFFHAGLELQQEDVGMLALGLGLALVAVVLPLRLALTALHRFARFGERLSESLRVGVPMLPTTVFTLVIAELLRDRFDVAPEIFGGLVVYMLVNTVLPGFIMHTAPVEELRDKIFFGAPGSAELKAPKDEGIKLARLSDPPQ